MLAKRPRIVPVLTLLLAAVFLPACGQEEREVTTTSDEAYICFEDGAAAVERFRLEEARDCFLKAVEHDPEFAMGWTELAVMQRQLGEHEEAEVSIEKALAATDTASEVEALWITRVHALFQRDLDSANATWERLSEEYPDYPRVLRLRAEFAKQDNDYETAHECYDKLLAAKPSLVSIHNLKGYLYLQQGDYEKAVVSLQRYAYYAPDEANPHDSLGEAYLRIGRYEEAIEEFETALDLDPAFLWSARNLAEALSITGQERSAIKVLEHIKPLFKERRMIPWWDMSRSTVAVRARNWDEVLQLSGENLTRLSEMGEHEKLEYELNARFLRTVALLELGNLEAAGEAVAELERVAQRVRDYGYVASLERPKQFLKVAEAAVRSRFARAEGTPASGISALEAALDAVDLGAHELEWPHYELAMAYLEAGQPDAAAVAAQRTLDSIPTSPQHNLVAARAYAKVGNRDLALAHLQTYLDVMRNADEGHRSVAEATALLQQLTPRS